jgi:hypothetical protein
VTSALERKFWRNRIVRLLFVALRHAVEDGPARMGWLITQSSDFGIQRDHTVGSGGVVCRCLVADPAEYAGHGLRKPAIRVLNRSAAYFGHLSVQVRADRDAFERV